MRARISKMTTRAGIWAAGTVTVAGLSLVPAQAAARAAISVPCDTADLVSAVASAPDGSTLMLTQDCTYVLDQGLPTIDRSLTIAGPATIERSLAARTPSFSIMSVGPGGDVTVRAVNFTNGFSGRYGTDGGAIYNPGGVLTVDGGVFSLNGSPDAGGAIYSTGDLDVTGAVFMHNRAEFGGAIFTRGSASIVSDSFTGNSAGDGGGLENTGSASVATSTFDSDAASFGGGIYNGSQIMIENTTIHDNRAYEVGGGIYSWFSTTLSQSTIYDNTPNNCAPPGIVTGCLG